MMPSDSENDYEVYTLQKSGWKKVRSEQIGSYLCFEMDGNGQFSVVPVRRIVWWGWVMIGIGSVGAVGMILLLGRKGKIRRCAHKNLRKEV